MGEETICPSIWHNEYADVFTAFDYLERNILPHSGGWADQPAKLMELVQIVADETATIMARKKKKPGG